MPQATIKSHSDAWVNLDSPHKNHGKGNRLWVRGSGSGLARQTYIGFAKPFPHNDALVVTSATLILRVKDDWNGSHDVTASRITETWREGRITWTNAPDITTRNQSTENVTNASNGDEVDIDVTDILGDVALGEDWFGIRLELDDDVPRAFYASDAPTAPYHPRLDVEWGFAPYPPTDLDPAGNQVIGSAIPVLTWSFRDIVQENTQASSRVEISSSTSFGTVLYDSGKQANTTHRWPLAGETTIADGATRYWRVLAYDDQNRASGWSDVAVFQRVSKGTITFVNPGPSNTVSDLTPLIQWTFTGTQAQVELELLEVLANKTTKTRFTFERQKYAADHLTIPARDKHPIIKSGHNYRLRLKIWDDEDRVGSSNDPAFAYAQIDFTYDRDGTPDPVATLTGAISPIAAPAILFTWTRTATPDFFCLKGNGEEIIHRLDPLDVTTGVAGQYSFTYWEATPRESVTYEMEAVVVTGDNNLHSDGNPTVTKTTNPNGVWLIDDDADDAVMFKGTDSPSITIGESATTYDLVGNQIPVRITDSIRGYEGSFNGLLQTSTARDELIDLKNRYKALRLVIANLNFPIWLEEVTVAPMPIPGGELHEAGFSFFQIDDFSSEAEY